jgi:hypothetical protein
VGAESVSLYTVNQIRDIAWSTNTVSLDRRVQYTNQVVIVLASKAQLHK